jgi:molybdenum cofactor cytidylyltransferase
VDRLERVGGVVLAAGLSSRMPGGSKLLAPFAGGTIVECAAEAGLMAGLDPLSVVVGHEGQRVAERFAARPVQVVFNPDYSVGRVSSLQAGLRSVDAGAHPALGAVVVLLGDEPNVRPEVVLRVVAEWRCTDTRIIRARYGDRPGHPVLIDRMAFPEVLALRPDDAVWESLVAAGVEALEVNVGHPAPVDVDRPEDLTAARRQRNS